MLLRGLPPNRRRRSLGAACAPALVAVVAAAPGAAGAGEVLFRDVTAESGLAAARGYGMGVAVGDYDGDGRLDLYVTNFGSNGEQ